eukprot:2878883-Amphidinium_carterae.1
MMKPSPWFPLSALTGTPLPAFEAALEGSHLPAHTRIMLNICACKGIPKREANPHWTATLASLPP